MQTNFEEFRALFVIFIVVSMKFRQEFRRFLTMFVAS